MGARSANWPAYSLSVVQSLLQRGCMSAAAAAATAASVAATAAAAHCVLGGSTLSLHMQAIGNGELFEQHQRLIEVRKQLADHDHVSYSGRCRLFGT